MAHHSRRTVLTALTSPFSSPINSFVSTEYSRGSFPYLWLGPPSAVCLHPEVLTSPTADALQPLRCVITRPAEGVRARANTRAHPRARTQTRAPGAWERCAAAIRSGCGAQCVGHGRLGRAENSIAAWGLTWCAPPRGRSRRGRSAATAHSAAIVRAESRRRCGSGEPSPGADVAAASRVSPGAGVSRGEPCEPRRGDGREHSQPPPARKADLPVAQGRAAAPRGTPTDLRVLASTLGWAIWADWAAHLRPRVVVGPALGRLRHELEVRHGLGAMAHGGACEQ